MLFFSDMEDILEALKPQKIYLLVSRKYGKKPIPYNKIATELKSNKVLVVVGGTSPGLTRKEMDLGEIMIEEEKIKLYPLVRIRLEKEGILNYFEVS